MLPGSWGSPVGSWDAWHGDGAGMGVQCPSFLVVCFRVVWHGMGILKGMGEAIGEEGEEERGAERCSGGIAGGGMGVQWGGMLEK